MATPVDPAVTTVDSVVDPLTMEPPIVTAERSRISSPIGWSAIFGAAFVTAGIWLVLHMIGIGIGLTAIDPDKPNSLRGVGVGTGIWSLIVPLIALFIGGLVAGRVAPTINAMNAAIHGAVVWAVTLIGATVLLMMMLASMARGVATAGSAVGSAAGTAVSAGAASGLSLSDLGLSSEDLVAPINQRLQAQGMPPVSANDLQTAAKDALKTSVRQGKLDRDTLVQSLTQHTSLSRADAEQVATQMEQRFNAIGQQGAELAQNAQQTALQVAETTGKALTVMSIVMLVGLGLAMLGAVVSVRHERKEHVLLPRAMTR
jgi:hypothetical protein